MNVDAWGEEKLGSLYNNRPLANSYKSGSRRYPWENKPIETFLSIVVSYEIIIIS